MNGGGSKCPIILFVQVIQYAENLIQAAPKPTAPLHAASFPNCQIAHNCSGLIHHLWLHKDCTSLQLH